MEAKGCIANNPKRRKERTGCITCRIRRVKCDEGRPNCQKCQSTGRKCDGYAITAVSRREICEVLRRDTCLVTLGIQAHGFGTDYERHSFDYFRFVTTSRTSSAFGLEFWTRRVLQLCQADPAIKHAVLALSSLHQYLEMNQSAESQQRHTFSLRSYNQAISHTSKLLSRSRSEELEKGLVACALFVCYENLAGNFTSALMHLQNGLRILAEREAKASRQAIPTDILHVFSGLDLQAMSFSDSRSPYPYPVSERQVHDPEPIPNEFTSVGQAYYHLFEFIKWNYFLTELYTVTKTSECPNNFELASILSKIAVSEHEIARWEFVFNTFLLRQKKTNKPDPSFQHNVILLQLYHATVVLTYDSDRSGEEIRYDKHMPLFHRIFDLVEQLPEIHPPASHRIRPACRTATLTFELGVVLPLFFATIKCRDPVLRRRGVALLYAMNRREGIWDSAGAAKVAEKMIEIEEGGLDGVRFAEEIPESRRVWETNAVVYLEKRVIELTCVLGGRFDLNLGRVGQVRNDVLDF